MTRQIGFLFAALTALVIATPASAQTTTTIAGGLRLHLETDVLGIVKVSPEEGDSQTTTIIGPGQSGLGFGVGYGISEQLIVGANIALQNRDGGGDDDGVLTIALLPYLEFLLGEGSVRPFVGGNLILSVSSTDNVSRTEFGLGGLGGVHIFLADSFSFDVSGRLFFTSGSVTVDTPAGDVDSSYTTFGLLVLLGVSGWGV